MKTISKHIRVSAFSLVLPAVFNAFSPSAYASLVDISQSQAYGSKPSALGSVGAGQEPLVAPFQTAAVHFITSPRNGNQFNGGSSQIVQDFTSEGLCANAGYHIISCPNGYIKGDACPEDKRFVRECIEPERWCRDNGYAITKCEAPNYPETVCPYSGAYYRSCKTDNIRACKEAGYSLTCETGMLGDNAQVCPYNASYKKCVCNPCLGFDYTDDQANAQGYLPGEVCNSCGNLKYKRTTNPCDGFMECKNGGTVGAEVCFSGSIKKFSLCDDGCDPNVFKYDQNNCSNGKELAGNSCGGKYKECVAAVKILYGDGSTSYDVLPQKKAIGIVINDGDGGYTRPGKDGRFIAMALTDVQSDGTPGSERLRWSEERCDTSLPNCRVNGSWSVGCSDNGRINTSTLLKETCSTFEAANAVYQYEPEGCSRDFCRRGNWFLPSDWEVSYLGGYATESAFDKLKNSGYNISSANGKNYWTSSEADADYVTTRSISIKYVNPASYSQKDYPYGYYVRPLIEFR